VIRKLELLAIALAGANDNMWSFRVVCPNRIKHVNFNVKAMMMKICRIKVMWNVWHVDLHKAWVSDRLLIILILYFFARFLNHLPIVCSRRSFRPKLLIGHVVCQLYPERLSWPYAHRRPHKRIRSFGRVCSSSVGIV
jgi:hypothetical protein